LVRIRLNLDASSNRKLSQLASVFPPDLAQHQGNKKAWGDRPSNGGWEISPSITEAGDELIWHNEK
jgi:hypothetical protein